MRRLLFIGLFLLPSMCFGQSLLRVQKFCEVGNQSVTTQGLASLTKVQRSFPLCLVTVYQSGTTNKANLFSDNLPVPTVLANPFTANVDGSFGFYAAPGACYDVVTSGAGFPNPFTYSYICLNSGGGGGSVNCPTALNGSMAAFTSPTGLSCDPNFFTDFAGNFTAQSGSFIGPVNGFTTYIGGGSAPGTQVKYKLPANAFRILAPTTVGTPYYFVPPSVRCSVGQVWGLASEATDANGDKVDTYQCQTSVAAGTEVQVNGVDTTAQTPINFQNSSSVTFTNTSAGNIQASTGAAAQASNPTAPTLTPNTPGSTAYSYAVVGCEDRNCANHSAISGITATSTGNANLATGTMKITGYGDTLYGYRFYKVCRTASAGLPATTGVIATGAGKSFIDNGLTGDGTNCASTFASNTTALDSHCLGSANPVGTNVIPGAPCGVDAPPTSPNALDDEAGATFGAPGDANNNLVWSWVNQGSCTATWTQGMISMSCPTDAGAAYHCLMATAPGTPYTFTGLIYWNNTQTANETGAFIGGLGLRESATGKAIIYGAYSQNTNHPGEAAVSKYSSTTVLASQVVSIAGTGTNPYVYSVQNTGTNTVYASSPDGSVFNTTLSETKNTFFTTGPDQFGMCLNAFGGTSTMEIDYLRRTL